MRNHTKWVTLLALCALCMGGCGALDRGSDQRLSGGFTGEVDWSGIAESLRVEATRQSADEHAKAQVNLQAETRANAEDKVPSRAQAEIQTVSSVIVSAPTPEIAPVVTPSVQEGARLAYVQQEDIWVKVLPDGEALRLTKNGVAHSPQWSSSGQWLSFLKNPEAPELWPELWIVKSDGTKAQQITSSSTPDSYAWSSVTDKLAVAKGVTVEIYTFKKGKQPLLENTFEIATAGSKASIGKVIWSPDGQQLAYTYSVPFSGDSAAQQSSDDGLWLLDVGSGATVQVVKSGVPDHGEIILKGWSSDGKDLLYWQGAILSASMMADGVPLYRVSSAGGNSDLVAESVLVEDDAVQSQPNGVAQVAVVEGSGREMWSNKRLHTIIAGMTEVSPLTPKDQAAASPAWSPDGESIAYVAMPNAEGVTGGDEAEAALGQRQVWIVDAISGEAHPLQALSKDREESPQWIDEKTILVARMAAGGNVSLWQIGIDGDFEMQVVDQITPAPDWFGFYGSIDWRPYFALWRAPIASDSGAHHGRLLSDFLDGLQLDLTRAEAIAKWGEADLIGGSGLLIYQYHLDDGTWLWLAFPGDGPLVYAQLHTPAGTVFELKLPPVDRMSETPAPELLTPTPQEEAF